MASHVIALKYLGPGASGNVGYQPRWYHMWRWRAVLPALLLANAVLQLLDVGTTWLALQAGAVEANPISAQMMAQHGFSGWVVAKLVLAFLFVAHLPLLHRLDRHAQRAWTGASALTLGLLMSLVVLNNTTMVLLARMEA